MNAIKAGGGDCHPRVAFEWADTLVLKKLWNWNRGHHWVKLVTSQQPEFVILTAGAHIRNRPNFTETLQEVLAGLDEVDASYALAGLPPPIIMWKTQQPAGCSVDAHKVRETPKLHVAGISPTRRSYDQTTLITKTFFPGTTRSRGYFVGTPVCLSSTCVCSTGGPTPTSVLEAPTLGTVCTTA